MAFDSKAILASKSPFIPLFSGHLIKCFPCFLYKDTFFPLNSFPGNQQWHENISSMWRKNHSWKCVQSSNTLLHCRVVVVVPLPITLTLPCCCCRCSSAHHSYTAMLLLLLFLCPSKTLVSYLCVSLRTSRCTHEDISLDGVFMQTILLQNIACHSRKNYGTQNSFHSGDPPHEWKKLQESLDNQKIYAKEPLETTTHRIGYSQKMDHRRLNNFI